MSLILLSLLFVCGSSLFSSVAQVLSEPTSPVWLIDMNENGNFLVLRDNTDVYFYTNNGSQFNKKSSFVS